MVLVELTIIDLPQITPIDQEICFGDTALPAPLGVQDDGYTYTWYDQSIGGSVIATGTTFTPPNPIPTTTTEYWVETVDGQGCESNGRTAVTLIVNPLPILNPITSIDNFKFCQNESTVIDAGYYSPLHSYSWSSTATTQSISINTGGVYTVTITNGNGCYSTVSTAVTEIVVPLVIQDDFGFCFGGLSILDAGTYTSNDTYAWSNNLTTQTIQASTGIYTVTVTNEYSCSATATTAVTPEACCIAEAGTLTVLSTDLCSGDDIVVTTNGTHQMASGYNLYYLLVNKNTNIIEEVNTTGTFNNISPGDYEIYSYVEWALMQPVPSPISNSNLLLSAIGTISPECYDLSLVEIITMPEAPSITVEYSIANGPTGQTNIAEITIIGGTPPYDIDFTYNGGNASFVNNIGLGVYTVTYWNNPSWTFSVTDANDCNDDDWVVESSSSPSISLSSIEITKETCPGDLNGGIDISVSGGTACIPAPEYIYSWSGPNSFTASTQDISEIGSGHYNYTITDCASGSLSGAIHVSRLTRSGRGRGANCNSSGNKTDLSYREGDTFLHIRPNPFQYATTIEFGVEFSTMTNISLYALDGRKVKEIYNSNTENDAIHRIYFEAENILPGMYLLQLITENGEMRTKKMVIK